MTDLVQEWRDALALVARSEKVAILSRFFKTAPGEYGEGDVFIGVNVPDNRAVAMQFSDAPLAVVEQMLQSEIHEHRLSGFLCLVKKYRRQPDVITDFYFEHAECANNWDLVDLSAPKIVGEELRHGRCKDTIRMYAKSQCLWLRRIAIVSTLQPVTKDACFDDALPIAKVLLRDNESLIQKAVGWILREIGKKDIDTLREFLHEHIRELSATTLSYATEKMDQSERKHWREIRNQKLRH